MPPAPAAPYLRPRPPGTPVPERARPAAPMPEPLTPAGSWDDGGRHHKTESRLPAFTEWTLRARDPYERAGAEPYRPGAPP